jgi:Na+/melibiose symporter-like transporter
MGIFTIVLFWCPENLSISFKTAWVYLFYILQASLTGTAFWMAYIAEVAVISPDTNDRVRLTGSRNMWIGMAMVTLALIMGLLLTKLTDITGSKGAGYRWSILLLGLVCTSMMVISGWKTKERYYQPTKDDIKTPFWTQFKSLIRNPYYIMIWLGMLVFGFQVYGRSAIQIYYFIYVGGSAALMSIYLISSGIVAIVIGPFAGALLNILGSKGRMAAAGTGLAGVCLVISYFFPAPHPIYFILQTLALCGTTLMSIAMYSMISDSVDWGEYKGLARADALAASGCTFSHKVGGAIGPWAIGLVLAYSNYVPNVAQAPETLRTINIWATLVPGIVSFVVAIIYLFYKIDNNFHGQIRTELLSRRGEGSLLQ